MAIITVTYQWDDNLGTCDDCGNPAAFRPAHPAGTTLFCAVCAANAAADGESIEWIDRPE